jgi:UrcA family protein
MNSIRIDGRLAVRTAWITILTLSASVLLKAAAATPALPEPRQMTIIYDDLDLTRLAGVAKLYRRIELAAAQVCKGLNSRVPENFARERLCARQAIARAVAQVGSPALSQYYASKAQRIDRPGTVAARP